MTHGGVVVSHSNTMDGVQSSARSGRRFIALSPGLLILPLTAFVVSWLFPGDRAAVTLIGTAVLAASAVVAATVLVMRARRLATSWEQLVRLERAMSTASAALLKRGVADPVGTALVALVEGVDASWVFLDSVGAEEADQDGIVTTVRDVLRTSPAGEPAGWDLMPWRVSPEARRLLEAGQPCEIKPDALDERSAAIYRVARIGSEIVIPISVEGAWVGNVGFCSEDPGRSWADDERQLLMVGAEMIGVYWERRDALGRLEELVAAKNEFIASVSHEVRTPLTAVLGFAQELNQAGDKFSDRERDDLIGLIAMESQEVANIVEDLLVAARAETGSIVISPERVSVKGIVGEVLSSHSGRVDFSTSVDAEIEIWADPIRTRQVLRNLLTNADRYGGATVEINVAPGTDEVAIEVRDSGGGIPEGLCDQIFEPYARGHDGRTQPASIGLGLSVARKLAQLMNGALTLKCEAGWTVFTVTLPRCEPGEPPVPSPVVATEDRRLTVSA
jgi:signal transduction histidine kinase